MTEPTKIPGKILWHCRRGMLELDEMLHRFVHNHYHELSEDEQATFYELLEMEDPHLYNILLEGTVADTEKQRALVQKILSKL